MSQVNTSGSVIFLPPVNTNSNTTNPQTQLNATGETAHLIGYVMLENPLGGSKTISAAGGGSIVWKSNLCTFANGGSTFKIGIQDVSTASSPAQGDGTFDVLASLTGGGGGISSSAVNTTAMTSGTKTINQGDLIAITFEFTTRAGTDSILISNNFQAGFWDTQVLPGIYSNTTGAYARETTGLPNAYIVFDDGTVGWIYGASFVSTPPVSQTFNSTTVTADEYGNLLYYPNTFYAIGIGYYGSYSANSSDLELILYSDPLGTPVAERTITVDATQLAATTTGLFFHLFSSPFLMRANTKYAVTLRPTTANSVVIYYVDNSSSTAGKIGTPNTNCYAVRRLDNSGAFSDYNGGTANTRKMSVFALSSYMEQGTNICSGQVGVY